MSASGSRYAPSVSDTPRRIVPVRQVSEAARTSLGIRDIQEDTARVKPPVSASAAK